MLLDGRSRMIRPVQLDNGLNVKLNSRSPTIWVSHAEQDVLLVPDETGPGVFLYYKLSN